MIERKELERIFKNYELICSRDWKDIVDTSKRYIREKLTDKVVEKKGSLKYYRKEDVIDLIMKYNIKPTVEYYKK